MGAQQPLSGVVPKLSAGHSTQDWRWKRVVSRPTSAVPDCPVMLALLAIETVFAATAPSRAAAFCNETVERGAYTVSGTLNAVLLENSTVVEIPALPATIS